MPQGRRLTAKDISASLSARISAGEWATTGQLPTEAELATTYGVARETLRKALAEIRNTGLISNQQGRGWFLGATPPTQTADILHLAESLRRRINAGEFDSKTYFPSEATLASDLGVTRHKVRKIVAELEKSGYLRMERGNGRVIVKHNSEGDIDA
jgi:DNA-binding GntR family transcriptional regulator